MTQARIVLRGAALEKAERLQALLQLGSVSELINVLFSRYGTHLEQTWEVQPVSPTYAKAEPEPDFKYPEPDFRFDDPITGL